jgi:[NiFe] hydrogenase assembly HybE family chaperone
MTDTDTTGVSPAELKTVFQHIAETRMAGLPILNPNLAVEIVGFRDWQSESIGVLITPWFMNLVCLPGSGEPEPAVPSGSSRRRTLPSGEVEFLTASDERIGPYLSCSLFSPMNDFQDMDTAVQVAEAVMVEFFKPLAAEPAPVSPPLISERLAQPVSRRGFLSALLPRDPTP